MVCYGLLLWEHDLAYCAVQLGISVETVNRLINEVLWPHAEPTVRATNHPW